MAKHHTTPYRPISLLWCFSPKKFRRTFAALESPWSQVTNLSATLNGPNQSLGLVAMSGPPRQMESAQSLSEAQPAMDGESESWLDATIISENDLAIMSYHFDHFNLAQFDLRVSQNDIGKENKEHLGGS